MQAPESQTASGDPRIAVFLCDKCYTEPQPWQGADRPAQLHRLQHKCAGDVNTHDVRQALEDGADGVLILGCLMADCLSGQDHLRALRSIYENQVQLKTMGLGLPRLRHEWVAPCEAHRLREVLDEFTRDVKRHLAGLGAPKSMENEA
jgi:coenzyme F420-reducing hydrogenase delta subunit